MNSLMDSRGLECARVSGVTPITSIAMRACIGGNAHNVHSDGGDMTGITGENG